MLRRRWEIPLFLLIVAVLSLGGELAALDGTGHTPDGYAGHSLLSDTRVSVSYYTVMGRTRQEIRNSLDTLGPRDPLGKRGDAYTSWYVGWSWKKNDEGRAALHTTECTVTVRVTLPRLKHDPAHQPGIRLEWARFTAALIEHENQHAQHVLIHGPEICEEIRKRYAEQGASFGVDDANALATERLQTLRAFDRDLDRRTNHGRLHGARWPSGS